MSRRVHSELLIEVSEDLAGENVLGKFDEEQNQDNLTHVYGPVDIELPASATQIEVYFPTGSMKLRFLAIMKIDTATGLLVHFDDAANDAMLLMPPVGTGMQGQFVGTVSADALYLSNPSSVTAVSFSIMMGFALS